MASPRNRGIREAHREMNGWGLRSPFSSFRAPVGSPLFVSKCILAKDFHGGSPCGGRKPFRSGSPSSRYVPPMLKASCASDRGPILVGTWSFSLAAIESAWTALGGVSVSGDRPEGDSESSSNLLDAIELACQYADLDLGVDSVGLGGLPDSSGRMSLDGAIMESPIRFAGVAALRRHVHPVSVARLVMERTEHTLLCGDDADVFADRHGLAARKLLSDDAKAAFETWEASRQGRDSGPLDQRTDEALLGLRPLDPGLGSEKAGRLFRPNSGREGAAPALLRRPALLCAEHGDASTARVDGSAQSGRVLRERGVGTGGVIRRDQVGCSQRARQHQPPPLRLRNRRCHRRRRRR